MLYLSLTFLASLAVCEGIGVSTKLDFGSSTSLKAGPVYKKPGDVCASNCHPVAISNKNDEIGDAIKTDVVVKIETKVDLAVNTTNKTFVDDTPDIPVVLGLAGTDYEATTARPNLFKPNWRPNLHANPHYQGKESPNGINPHLPYFEPSYNKHYFTENQPNGYVWSVKIPQNALNPVEFRNDLPKINWKSMLSFENYSPNGKVCLICPNNERNYQPSSQWYPNFRSNSGRYPSFRSNSGRVTIDDKLAPLN